jgi:hypothetical protein
VSAKGSDSGNFTTGRVSLTGAATKVYLGSLEIFFPSHTYQCRFNYANFNRPVLIITSWSSPETCMDAAKEELKADGLPVDSFVIEFGERTD